MLHDDTFWSLYGLQHLFDVVLLMLHDDTLWSLYGLQHIFDVV